MSQSFNQLYEFGPFRLDAVERVLWRGEEMLSLAPKVFDTLWMLVERDGRVVSKSELMQAIWADAFVEESNLSQNIYTLRRALGVDEEGRQFIETVPRRGYRFAAPVKIIKDVSTGPPTKPTEDAPRAITALVAESIEHAPATPIDPSNTYSRSPETSEVAISPSFAGETRTSPASRYALLSGLGVLVLSAVGFATYQLVTQRGTTDQARVAPIEQVRFQRLTDSGDVVFPTISPNGELLAYVRHEDDEESVWVKQIATGSSIQTLPPSRNGYRSLAFSPDGKYLFFREELDPGAIYQASVIGGTPRKVGDNVWSDFSVSPDGKQFAFLRRDAARSSHLLVLSNIDGSGERELSARQTPLDYRGGAPSWSPDGSRLVVAAGLEQQLIPNLLTVEVATGQETELQTPRWRSISRTLWMPSGKHLIVAARATDEPTSQLWMISFPEGEIRRLTNDLEGYFWLSLSADGRMLVTRQQRIFSHLWLLSDGDVMKAKQLTRGERSFDGYVGLAWTPDNRIIFSAFAGRNTDLYSMNADGSNRVQLTADSGQDNTDPTVSPDGRYIVFTSNRTGTRQIWRMDVDGGNQKQLTFGAVQTETAQYAALSADGTDVLFVKHGDGPASIWKVPIDGGTTAPVLRLANAATEGLLSVSPNGKWLAYRHVSVQPGTRGDEPTTRIGVMQMDGSAESRFFDLPIRRATIQWSADSAAFDYAAGTFNTSSLWRQPLGTGEPQKLSEFPDRVFNLAWSRDRKTLAVSRGRQQGDAILITNLP